MAGPDNVIEMPALGRPFQLGMLYDCHKDALLSEHSLFDPEIHQRNTCKKIPNCSIMDDISFNTIGEKAAALNIKPSLLTSLLCGLFEVNGSAKYLLSTKKSRHQDSTTYRYLAIESGEREVVSLNSFGPEHFSYPTISWWEASHVVTAVQYGAQAFVEYDRVVSSSENSREGVRRPGGKMSMFPPQDKSALETDDEEKPQNQIFNYRFYGDFSLENDLDTFHDPTKIHTSLPKLLGEHRENAVPITVRLYPLKKLRLQTPPMPYACSFHEISDVLNYGIRDEIGDLLEIDAQCNELLKSPAAKTFPEIKKKIQHFRDLCKQHKQAFQKQLAEIVPSIRGGKKEEKELEEVLKWKKQSLFNTQRLSGFLDKREQEIAFVNSVLASLNETQAVCLKQELSERVFDPRTDFVVAFVFTSLHEEEPYLSQLKASLSSLKQPDESEEETQSSTGWYEETPVIKRAREQATSFSAFATANLSRKKTQFVVASTQDKSNPGASIYLYESGHLKETKFEPPSKPLPLEIEEISHDSVQLRFTPAQCGKDTISCFQFEYRTMEQENWVSGLTNGRGETSTVRGLCPDTEYLFRYAAVSKPGLSENSDIGHAVRTLPVSPPRTPKEANAGAPGECSGNQDTSAEEKPTDGTKKSTSKGYQREKNVCQQNPTGEMENVGDTQTLTPHSVSDDVATSVPNPKGKSENMAYSLCQASHLIRKGPPSVYALTLEEPDCDPDSTSLKYRFGKEEGPRFNHKVILLLGETGAGKSTLLNRMINHILGVQWEDTFRFSVIQKDPKRSQAQSQTDQLAAYEIQLNQGLQVPYSLTIIDTPGFGDTRGISRDKKLLEQICEFFSAPDGIDHIDAVCIVAQASQARLTQSQEYIFHTMLSIFGKDIIDNIQILITFADGQTPPVLEAIKAGHVPCAKDEKGVPIHFPLNNSALFASNIPVDGDSCCFDQLFWEMGRRSMKMFFQSLNYLEPQSLTLSADVLNARKALEASVQGIKPQIRMALMKMEGLRKTSRALEKHRSDMDANRNFEYEVEKIIPMKTHIHDTSYSSNNCQNCQFTCHYPCRMQDSREKGKCVAVDKSSQRCNVCPGKCKWTAHRSESYRWDYLITKEKHSYTQLKERYEATYGKQITEKKAFEWLQQEFAKAEVDLVGLIEKSSYYLRKLQEHALKPITMTIAEYIDLLISSEEGELQPGYEDRIAMLKYVKGKVPSNPSTRQQRPNYGKKAGHSSPV